MQTIIETAQFTKSATLAGVTAEELSDIVTMLAADPEAGDLMEGTGGARKMRFARNNSGKSGGYRIITYFGGADIPVFLLDIFGKNQKANLSKADRNALSAVLSKIGPGLSGEHRSGGISAWTQEERLDMTEAGRRLIEAAKEALAIARGDADPATYVEHAPPATVDVRAIRKEMGMTQSAFGARFGFGVARIRDWEQGRTRPAASDRVLLVTIKHSPSTVLEALARADRAGLAT